MTGIVRTGDTSTHGGDVTGTGCIANNLSVALDGDILHCPIHGSQAISASSNVYCKNRAVVKIGDSAACGAVISSGSQDVIVQ